MYSVAQIPWNRLLQDRRLPGGSCPRGPWSSGQGLPCLMPPKFVSPQKPALPPTPSTFRGTCVTPGSPPIARERKTNTFLSSAPSVVHVDARVTSQGKSNAVVLLHKLS